MTDLPRLGRSQADHLRLVLEESGIGAWELDIASGAAWRNPRHDEIFGYSELLPEWTYERFLEHVVDEDRDAVDALYGASLERGEPWSFECRIVRADGEERWISATGRPIKDAEGETVRLIGHVLDITHVKQNEERLRTVLHELDHRVRNTLMIVQAIASRSFPDDVDVAEGRRNFDSRIYALSQAHAVLTNEGWRGADLSELVRNALDPYCGTGGTECSAEGPEVSVSAQAAVNLAMTLNELATNAVKYGALSEPEGRVRVSWQRRPGSAGEVEMTWTESGGPRVFEPERTGFGLSLIRSLLSGEGRGETEIEFRPEGLRCRLRFGTAADGAR